MAEKRKVWIQRAQRRRAIWPALDVLKTFVQGCIVPRSQLGSVFGSLGSKLAQSLQYCVLVTHLAISRRQASLGCAGQVASEVKDVLLPEEVLYVRINDSPMMCEGARFGE